LTEKVLIFVEDDEPTIPLESEAKMQFVTFNSRTYERKKIPLADEKELVALKEELSTIRKTLLAFTASALTSAAPIDKLKFEMYKVELARPER
jgi:hypothetical protein